MYQGPVDNPLERKVGDFEWDYNGYNHRWPNGVWVQSFYQVLPDESDHPAAQTGDLLVGFIHREWYSHTELPDGTFAHGAGSANAFYIGLAVSFDRGVHWKYNGDVISNPVNGFKQFANVGGVPFFKIGDDFQLFFNEYPGQPRTPQNPNLGWVNAKNKYLSAARCNIRETVDCLIEGKLPRVRKYSGNGVFDTEPMFETGAPILPEPNKDFDAHGDAAWCPALGKYLVLAFRHRPTSLRMFMSSDGVTFDESIVLHSEGDEDTIMNPYSTFVAVSEDDSSADCSTVGREFYVFYPRKGRGGIHGYDFDQLFRRKIVIE